MARLFKTPVTVEGAISTNNVFTSTIATGTAPFTVSSTTLVTNLNADMLEGYSPATANGASTIVLRDASGAFAAGAITGTSFNSITGLSSTTPAAPGTAAVGTATTAARADHVHASPTSIVATVTGTNSADLVYGNMADNDQFRIRVGGTATNAGFAEIATADDGTEPIYVRQYTGVFTTLARTATLLDGSGNTSFPGTVTGTTFSGSGASLTNVPAANVTGTLTSTVLGNSAVFIGTTSVALNRTTGSLALTGISSVTLPGSTSGTAQIIPTAVAGTGTVITLPATTGTVALTANKLSVFAATTSAELLGVISDETGSGALVFATSPTLVTPSLGVATATSLTTSGSVTTSGALNLNYGSPTIASSNASTASIFTTTVTGVTIGSSTIRTTAFPADATTSTAAAGLGYMGIPQNSTTTGAYTIVAGDAGEHIYSTGTRTVTIPSNNTVAFPIGTTISFVSGSGATTTIAITTDTLQLVGGATANTAGTSRTLAAFGMATAVKVASTTWYISGNGLT